jgi:hypothetical protein
MYIYNRREAGSAYISRVYDHFPAGSRNGNGKWREVRKPIYINGLADARSLPAIALPLGKTGTGSRKSTYVIKPNPVFIILLSSNLSDLTQPFHPSYPQNSNI